MQSREKIRAQLGLWREGLAAHGHRAGPDQPLLREFYVAPGQDEAVRSARRGIEAKYGAYAEHGFPGSSERLAEGLDKLLEDTFIVGDPEHCVARLSACAELGFTHVGLRVLWPAMEQGDVLRMIDLIGAKVIPCLRAMTP